MTFVELKGIDSLKTWIMEIYGDLKSPNSSSYYDGYASLLEFDKRATKAGMPTNPAYWNCPICKTCWRDCDHTIQETYPTWEDKPW